MARLSFVLGGAWRDLRRTGAAGIAAVLLVALAAVATGATLLGGLALSRLVAGWRAELRIVAVLDSGGAANGASPVVPAARALPGAAAVRYVSAREALGDLREYLASAGLDGDGLERLPKNPLPARLVVTPAPDVPAAGLSELVAALRQLPGVETVHAAVGWVEPVERLQRGLARGGLGLGGLLGVTALAAVAGATALARDRRREETAILRQAGAPEWTLRAPLILQAMTLGTAGAALGVAALVALSETAAPWTAAWLRDTLGLVALPALTASPGGALLGGGLALGLLGGLTGGRP
jgi:cell division transport system permease protein